MGFFRDVTAPSLVAILRNSTLPARPPPEIATIFTSGSWRFISMINSIPSLSGMMMSVMTRSNFPWRNFSIPSTPFAAVTTVWPLLVMALDKVSMTRGSSSTRRILAIAASPFPGLGPCRLGGLYQRQVDRESGAAARLAVHQDGAAMTDDDPVRDRKPQPGAFPDTLCGEERLEYSFRGLAVHPGPGVSHRENGAGTARRHAGFRLDAFEILIGF